MKRKPPKVLGSDNTPVIPADAKILSVEIPDEAVDYIVSRFLMKKANTGESVITGISTDTVETVLSLLVDWGAATNRVKQGVLFLGGKNIG